MFAFCLAALAPSVAAGNEIVSAGPLKTIRISPDLNCYVDHVADSHTEFYGGTACGTLIVSEGTLYGPENIPAGGNASPRTAWTPISQSGPVGVGTPTNPFRITTVVRGGDLQVIEVDSYVVGEESYRTDVTVTNTGSDEEALTLYRAGDCYLQNSDYGYGRIDGDSPTCVAAENDGMPGDRIEQFTPISAGSHYYQAGYWEVWEWIGSQRPFPDTCRCNEHIDNGAGLSWGRSLPADQSTTISSLITFSPVGTVPIVITKKADSESVEAGGVTGYTINVANPNVREATLTELIDDLPAGFAYLAGSTSGVTSADPEITGQHLVWRNLVIPAHGSIVLHFAVRVSDVPGTYVNTASGVGAGLVVVPAEEASPLPVTKAEIDRPDLFLEKSPDEPTLIAASTNGYTIDVSNPGSVSLTLNQVTETLPVGFTYVSDSTTGITTKNPTVDGRRLTWAVSTEVPPFSSVKLHFLVRVPLEPGIRTNPLVSGRSPDGQVERSRETAPVKVIPRPIRGGLRLRKVPSRRLVPAGQTVRFVLTVRDLAPKTGTTARICDRLAPKLRLVSAPGAKVEGRRICWRRPMPAKLISRRVAYVARAKPGAVGPTASSAYAIAFERDPSRARAGVTIQPLLVPTLPPVTG